MEEQLLSSLAEITALAELLTRLIGADVDTLPQAFVLSV
jgi:hypothetical protein